MSNSTNRKTKTRKSNAYCGVFQCNTYRGKGISMFKIPQRVRQSPRLLRKWSKILRNGNPFPKYFSICNRHFEQNQILKAFAIKGIKRKAHLSECAFPTLNLPTFVDKPKYVVKRKPTTTGLLEPIMQIIDKSPSCEEDPLSVENDNTLMGYEKPTNQLLRELDINSNSKSTFVNFDPFVAISCLCDNDEKLKTMTGLNSKIVLDFLASECIKLRSQDNDDYMSMKDKIILSMFKLKTNVDFFQLAALFQISEETAQEYFADTIKRLAEAVHPTIDLNSEEQIVRNLPTCFEDFPNVKLVVEFTELNSFPPLKVVIGFAPSGLINYVSKVANGKFSDRAIIYQVDLLQKLKRGDAVIVSKGLFIRDDIYGIEVISCGKNFRENKKVTEARVYIRKHMASLKMFKVLSQKIQSSIIPLMDEIMIVLCGISNKNASTAV